MSDHSIKDGGPAFPRITEIQTPNSINWERPEYSAVRSAEGMTLRDYFAAKAMQAIVATPDGYDTGGADHIAALAYQMADAMLKARAA